jgi:hypothetical protein
MQSSQTSSYFGGKIQNSALLMHFLINFLTVLYIVVWNIPLLLAFWRCNTDEYFSNEYFKSLSQMNILKVYHK